MKQENHTNTERQIDEVFLKKKNTEIEIQALKSGIGILDKGYKVVLEPSPGLRSGLRSITRSNVNRTLHSLNRTLLTKGSNVNQNEGKRSRKYHHIHRRA